MEFRSWLFDFKVSGVNVGAEMTIGEYWDVAKDIIDENEFQRRKVTVRGKPYQLLQRDLIEGCVIPPIILALKQETSARVSEHLVGIEDHRLSEQVKSRLSEEIVAAFLQRKLLILDGLQRTFTIQDCITQLAGDTSALQTFLSRKLRVEIYLGLNKMGILYRMLTLNTGQTPMSFRHQIEMLYGDYLDVNTLPDGISVIRESDDRRARGERKYKYSDVVDMFYAFSTGKPESIDKQTLVNKLGELEFLEEFKSGADELQALLITYNQFVRKLEEASGDWVFDNDRLRSQFSETISPVDRPFGKNVASIFERVQPMTAFGSECKRLIRQGSVSKISELSPVILSLKYSGDPNAAMDTLVLILDEIAKKATKIGTAQRETFQYAFRALLNEDSDAYQDLSACWMIGQQKFESLN